MPKQLAHFACTSVIEATEAFFIASDADVASYVEKIAERRGINLSDQSSGIDILSPGDFVRLQIHKSTALALAKKDDTVTDLVDPRQTTARGRMTMRLGALTTKAIPTSVKLGREMLPVEKLWAMGLPIFKDRLPDDIQALCKFSTDFMQALVSLPDTVITRLVGNGMSLAVVGTALGFSLSQLEPISRAGMSCIWHDSDSDDA